MKCHWQIRRRGVTTLDGQRRWDRAYQQLLQWTAQELSELSAVAPIDVPPAQEVNDASSPLHSDFDAAASRDPHQ